MHESWYMRECLAYEGALVDGRACALACVGLYSCMLASESARVESSCEGMCSCVVGVGASKSGQRMRATVRHCTITVAAAGRLGLRLQVGCARAGNSNESGGEQQVDRGCGLAAPLRPEPSCVPRLFQRSPAAEPAVAAAAPRRGARRAGPRLAAPRSMLARLGPPRPGPSVIRVRAPAWSAAHDVMGYLAWSKSTLWVILPLANPRRELVPTRARAGPRPGMRVPPASSPPSVHSA
eukprot:CAMPEP_0172157328 /NCGR_PEP_ID=MMETSP1050-20130122/3721_1 /TAXON_ID=233186 /ORGANISM="Cryptomonas curvata, Strain CCAP979/52" /LENGTH=236 /DNA_ID=CAMNT_0012826527 /DNA_START=543 /DNA_END=1249 /DNA_ORIENTATION=-